MSKENRPAFFFYANDFLGSTATMEPAEVGMYIRLLSHQWVNGPFPSKFKIVCRLAGIDSSDTDACSMLQALLEHKFSIDQASNYSNKRLEIERAASLQKTAEAKAKAKAAADARWEKDRLNKSKADFGENGDSHLENLNAPSNAPSNAKVYAQSMLTESEHEYESEHENRNENREVQGGNRPPKFDAAKESREFQAVYSLKQGAPFVLERVYAQTVKLMFNRLQIPYSEAAKRLKQAAGDFMTYHTKAQTGTQFIEMPETFLEKGKYETDWIDAALKIKIENSTKEKNGKSTRADEARAYTDAARQHADDSGL